MQWLQQVSQGHLFHTLFHEARGSHVLLTRFQVFHIKHRGSQLACLSHLSLWIAHHQRRKALHFRCSLKIMLIFFYKFPSLPWAYSPKVVMPLDPKGQVAEHVKPSVFQVSTAFTIAALFCLSENALQLIELHSAINLRWKNEILGRSGSPSSKKYPYAHSFFFPIPVCSQFCWI